MNTCFSIRAAVFSLAACAALPALADVKLSKICETSRPSAPGEEISGVTWAGGNLYYAVDDKDKCLYPLTLDIASDGSLAKTNITIGAGVAVEGADDMEGCAWDPASGKVWVSDEYKYNPTIREIDPAAGQARRAAPVPANLRTPRGNFSLEALTISGDGLSMWTCNEEALPGDGEISSKSTGTIVRLTRFIRPAVYDNWVLAGQYAYLTEPIGTDPWVYDGDTKGRSGVSALAALPDGSLLVLERTLSGDSWWTATFYTRIYRVDGAAEDGSPATDVSSIASLAGADFKRIKKTPLFDSEVGWVNYEGMCLGPRLEDGSTVVVLVSDGGSCTCRVMTLKLTGLDIHTLSFEPPVRGAASIAGAPYRFLAGSRVSAALSGAEYPSAYTNNAAEVCSSIAWSCGAASGTGSSAEFTVSEDAAFKWLLALEEASTPIDFADSFEARPLYASVEKNEAAPWSGKGEVLAVSPDAPPAGFPMAKDPHTKALGVEENVSCAFPGTVPGPERLELFVAVRRRLPDETDGNRLDNAIAAIDCDSLGHLRLWTASGWQSLGQAVYADGQWIRVAFSLGGGVLSVAVDGVERAVVPVDAASIVALDVYGGVAIDDVLKTSAAQPPELAPSGAAGEVPVSWLLENGFVSPSSGFLLAPETPCPAEKYPARAAAGYTVRDIFAAGLDAALDALFNVAEMGFLPDGRLYLALDAARTDLAGDAAALAALYPVSFRERLDGEETPVPGTVALEETQNGAVRTVWTSLEPPSSSAGFYCVKVAK